MMACHDLMSIHMFNKCLQILCDAIIKDSNETNEKCLKEYLFNGREELKRKVDPYIDRLTVQLYDDIDKKAAMDYD